MMIPARTISPTARPTIIPAHKENHDECTFKQMTVFPTFHFLKDEADNIQRCSSYQ